ncbi:DivIVA domain-containing protein [Micromonospora zingiberis]|uniref:DivIVA domain-containing protein n=1 Tax=Micromonospora zingiberis TaxID=2053011 RepID=A0A4R0G5S2_9ACTN|nr:DivIVA domain-containing protein [Micromonospora zingiberis]TCB92124.1 DivIVA domain-containing protein [Micromonospora zingiberis]
MTRGNVYGSRPPRLHPSDVRDRQFPVVGFGRRGLDQEEVRQFLYRVARELAILYQDLARLDDENVRLKRALRDWQTAQARRRTP